MKPLRVAICLLAFVFIAYPSSIRAQIPVEKRIRVLVDASKDGGLWWFPQGSDFDPRLYHQGKGLADSMRRKGWDVVELPRGEIITLEKLSGVDVIVRPPAFFSYGADEVAAYRDSILNGTRLLLMGGAGPNNDAVAETFGLLFESRNRFGAIKQWIPHVLTRSLVSRDLSWTAIREVPPSAILLAWLNADEVHPQPVLGYLPYGQGYILFVGQVLIPHNGDQSFASSLLNSLGRYSREEISQFPIADLTFAAEPAELAPQLISPIADATLPQPDAGEWRFSWEEIPGAKNYEIVVLGPAAVFPLARATTARSSYVVSRSGGYIAEMNLRGWSWRVRCQYANGVWSDWSRTRRFNISPRGF